MIKRHCLVDIACLFGLHAQATISFAEIFSGFYAIGIVTCPLLEKCFISFDGVAKVVLFGKYVANVKKGLCFGGGAV